MLPVELVKKSLQNLEKELTLKVYESKEMFEFAEKLSHICGKIKIEFVESAEPTLNLPAIKVGNSGIFFHAVPEHSELESFLYALKLVSAENENEPADSFTVTTLVSKICPNCRKTVDAINRIAVRDGLEHHVVDVSSFPEIAEKYGICSVPTAIIGEFRLTGAMNDEEIVKWIKAAKSGEFNEYISEKLMNGEIDEVIRIGGIRNIGRELAKLMAHREFMVRLGAMAAIESLNEKRPEALEGAKEVIRELLRHEDERIREDAAMMLGIIGSEEDAKYMETLSAEGRVGESVREAIESIRGKNCG